MVIGRTTNVPAGACTKLHEWDLRRFLHAAVPSCASAVLAHVRLDSKPNRLRSRRQISQFELPVWHLLPEWVARDSGPERARSGRGIVRRVQWGQYCLYLAFRLQDDLLDGQSSDPRFMLVGDRLLLEAEENFTRILPPASIFWKHYRNSIARTTEGILALAAAEMDPTTSPQKLLNLHVRVGSVFRVGCIAMAVLRKMPNAIPGLCRGVDRMSAASQILDDWRDLEEDEGDRVYNYAWHMLRKDGSDRTRKARKTRLVQQVLRRLRAAERMLRESCGDAPGRYFARYRTAVLDMLGREYPPGVTGVQSMAIAREIASILTGRAGAISHR